MKQRNFFYVALLIIMAFIPFKMKAIKVNMGTITIEVGQQYKVDASYGYEKSQSGYWEKSNSTFTFIAQGQKSCTIRGNQEGTGILSYWGSVLDNSYNHIEWEPYWTVVVQSSKQKISLSMSPSGGVVSKGDYIRFISSPADDLITFYYTTDGTDPKSSSSRISTTSMNGFTITKSCTVKAYASAAWVSSKYTDSDVITNHFTVTTAPKKERTIHIEEPGTLNQFISEEDKSTITDLTLTGKLNGTDLRLLRYMAGLSHERDANTALIVTNGKLSVLDLRDVSFVQGGDWYLEAYQTEWYTYNSDDLPDYAFAWCPRLTKIYLPRKSTKLRYFALHWLENLEEVELPQGLTVIEENFSKCINLKTLSIPAGVTSVSYESFNTYRESGGLSTIYCYANTPPSVSYSFPSNLKDATLFVPKGSQNDYQTATGWKDFKTIVANIEPSILISDISLDESSLILTAAGEMKQLSAIVMPNNATNKTLIWSSSNEDVATVSDNGIVIAQKDGKAKITCKANDGSGKYASCDVTVCIGGIAINKTNFPDENFRNFLLNYSVGRDGVITEKEIQQITALQIINKNIERLKGIEFFTFLNNLHCERNKIKGTAMDELIDCLPQITSGVLLVYDDTVNDEGNECTMAQVAAAEEKGWRVWYWKASDVMSSYPGCDYIEITLPSTMTVMVGESITLTPTIIPADAMTTLTWSSDDESIATVNNDGVVTGVKAGQTVINVETDNGKTAYCKLTVTEPVVKVTSIKLDRSTMTLEKGKSQILSATVKPDNATDKTVTWSSSNTGVATVDNSGKVTAVAAGEATITCTANDGSGVKATCEVSVKAVPQSITLPSPVTVVAGQTVTLTPTITPADAETTLTWSSDDETIATVNSEGVVTGVKAGQTFINVETDNGLKAYCKLTVTAPEVIKITIPENMTLTVGEKLTLTAVLTPEEAEATLTWRSDDETIVRVSANDVLTGELTGVAEGLALVTVTTSNGLTSNACKVKVEPDLSGISDIQAADRPTPVYTLSGQRLAAPKKGINIVGGRKVVVK